MINILAFLLLTLFYSPQKTERSINPNDLKFGELNLISDQKTIWEILGEVTPKRVFYECGFHSEDEQGVPFFELRYTDVTWVGNEEEGYILQSVYFDLEGKTEIQYKDLIFNGKTTQQALENLFDEKATTANILGRENEKLEWINLYFENADDGCHFIFKNGKLLEFGYYSPC